VDEIARRVTATTSSWANGPGPNVLLAGPEPFSHPALPAVVRACRDAGVRRIGVETDGGALAVGENAAGALQAGVRHLRVRVLAGGEELADALAERPGLARTARTGVRRYREAAEASGIPVVVTAVVPLCEHNVRTVPHTVAALASWHVDAVHLVATERLGDEVEAHVAAACDTGMVNRVWVEVDAALPLPPTHALHISREGGVRG
jgi:molybdenum cofactor biosynthesis enzyme MoaA